MKIFGVVGWKNSGKTDLMERLVHDISARGFSVSTLKHAHHRFDVDQPGKDSYRHRLAGAVEVLLSSRNRWALMHELGSHPEPELSDLLQRLSDCDLVLIEGYKRDDHPKIEANRAATKQPLIAPDEKTVLAVASDQDLDDPGIPVFDLNNTTAIAEFILHQVGLTNDIAPNNKGIDLAPPKLNNDCFALPAGVNWMPVDDALDILRTNLSAVTDQTTVKVPAACGRILAVAQKALRSNPPRANSAVDGYGFAHSATGSGPQQLTLVQGRAAAGAPFTGTVPAGRAVRILTGALLPEGVDTVVLEEDVTCDGVQVAFHGPIKPGANARRAGEDIQKNQVAVPAGQVLRTPELAFLTGIGVAQVAVRRRLRVGVLSTGDELVAADDGHSASDKTYDANRPMLLSLADRWGYRPVDFGHINDDRELLAHHFDSAAKTVDVMLTTGGASAGDEDHVSALLKDQGAMRAWRIALKPGRPLALGMWQGMPIFGLPGNPVAALVCALIFARPSLSVLAGGNWLEPQGYLVPADFEKNKKPGRREYLRARMTQNGHAEVFTSEGSGRISSLSWANGLVELGDDAQTITKGRLVRYIPYGEFGL